MKTAIERYFETITVQEKQKIMAEQEMKSFMTNASAAIKVIEDSISESVSKGLYSTIITFIKRPLFTECNGLKDLWYIATPKSEWTDFNYKVNAHYTIPVYNIPLLTLDEIISQLKANGFIYEAQDITIPEALSRTGKYSMQRDGYQIIINWDNKLTILGEGK